MDFDAQRPLFTLDNATLTVHPHICGDNCDRKLAGGKVEGSPLCGDRAGVDYVKISNLRRFLAFLNAFSDAIQPLSRRMA